MEPATGGARRYALLLLLIVGCAGATGEAGVKGPAAAAAEQAGKEAAGTEAARDGAAAAGEAGDEAAGKWLELDGARMLVTTTRAAQGRRDAALPLLVVMHWSKSTPAELLEAVRYVDLDAPARIVAIEGFERDGEGFSWWRRTRPAPEPADPDRDDELISLLQERAARLATLLGAIQRHFGSATPPVVSGISQGGDLSIMLAVHHPQAIAAALPIGSRFPSRLWPPRRATPPPHRDAHPLLDAFQGIADPVAPFPALERAISTLSSRGLPVQLHPFPNVKHEVTPAVRAAVQTCAALRLRSSRQPCPAPR